MNYVVAVSGGVDSVVLLDMMSKRHDKRTIIVAHYDHGIRGEESYDDAEFVRLLTQKYGVYFVSEQGNLSSQASEAEAREKRYEFLKRIATQFNAKLVTAHHQDDLIETIALNLARGTGWRGLAVFDNEEIKRPLLNMSKQQLYEYALNHSLEWVEDATNASDRYLRNRLRSRLSSLPSETKQRLVSLRGEQLYIRQRINAESRRFTQIHSRYFYMMIDDGVAHELLKRLTAGKLLTTQLERLQIMIKVAKPGSVLEVGAGLSVEFTRRDFTIKYSGELLY